MTKPAEAASFVKERLVAGGEPPQTVLVLGSGLGGLAEALEGARAVPFQDVPGFAGSTVAGHAGRLLSGRLAGKPVFVLQGRLHFYEGHTMEQVTFPYRVLKRAGAKNLILTSAVGGVSPKLAPGDLMAVRDHVNFMGENPLRGPHSPDFGERFPDMSSAYSADLRKLAQKAAKSLKISLKEGIYCAVRGPSYETPAEIRLFGKWGADVVGMSVVPEVVVSNQEGMKILAIACVTNKAAGLSKKPLSHEEVMETGARVREKFSALITKIVGSLP
jgi:purine-nucleoside phosphorylase